MLKRDKAALEIQRIVSFCLLVVFGAIVVILFRTRFRYAAADLEGVRKRYRELRRQHPGAMLLCTNHLTLIDSIVQGILLCPLSGYLTSMSALPWNLPERKNFNHAISWRVACYLGRCIPVTRGASSEESRRTQEKMRYVLNRGDIISIFPEGKRSRSGRVDDQDFSYGTGHLLELVPDATVLCVYLRGLRAGGFRDWPITGERFFVDMEILHPVSDMKGRRRVRDVSGQIIRQLKSMEDRFFALPGQ